MHRVRALIIGITIGILGVAGTPANATHEDKKVHHLALQVTANDPAAMTLALNNAVNVAEHYSALAEEVEIEIVAYGPGLHMLRDDTSPVKDRVRSIAQSMPGVVFTACGNTQTNMEKAEGRPITLLSQAKVVKTGVARLMELQEAGWTYIRP